MVYGHTPFAHLPFIQKMHAIIDPNHTIAMPPIRDAHLADVIARCLDRSPATRVAMSDLLEHPFLHPERAAAPAVAAVGALTKDQVKALLTQATAEGRDLDALSEALMRQLSTAGAGVWVA